MRDSWWNETTRARQEDHHESRPPVSHKPCDRTWTRDDVRIIAAQDAQGRAALRAAHRTVCRYRSAIYRHRRDSARDGRPLRMGDRVHLGGRSIPVTNGDLPDREWCPPRCQHCQRGRLDPVGGELPAASRSTTRDYSRSILMDAMSRYGSSHTISRKRCC